MLCQPDVVKQLFSYLFICLLLYNFKIRFMSLSIIELQTGQEVQTRKHLLALFFCQPGTQNKKELKGASDKTKTIALYQPGRVGE